MVKVGNGEKNDLAAWIYTLKEVEMIVKVLDKLMREYEEFNK
jgi:hypothetical protein